jgi:hypothetical protein
MNGLEAGAEIYGPQDFPDPPDRSTFNGGGGGGGSGIGYKEGAHLNG